MGSISHGLMLILLLALFFLGVISFIAWKTDKTRWLIWIVPFLFVGTIFCLAYSHDHDFWRSSRSLYRAAQEAAAQGDRTRALDTGPEGLDPGPE